MASVMTLFLSAALPRLKNEKQVRSLLAALYLLNACRGGPGPRVRALRDRSGDSCKRTSGQ